MIKIELLLAGDDLDPSFMDGRRQVRVTVHDPSLLAGLAHGEATEAAPPYGVLLELAADNDEYARKQLAWASSLLHECEGLDRSRCSVIAGPEVTVVAGDEPIMLGMALTRRADLTYEAFSEHWRTTHAELGRAVPGSEGYRQVHLDDALTADARASLCFDGPCFDGMALAYYSSVSRFHAILADTQVTSVLLEDEQRFLDHSHAAMVVGRAVAAAG